MENKSFEQNRKDICSEGTWLCWKLNTFCCLFSW
jgi:hypothetical protein